MKKDQLIIRKSNPVGNAISNLIDLGGWISIIVFFTLASLAAFNVYSDWIVSWILVLRINQYSLITAIKVISFSLVFFTLLNVVFLCIANRGEKDENKQS